MLKEGFHFFCSACQLAIPFAEAEQIVCVHCGRTYLQEQGVLLLDEAMMGAEDYPEAVYEILADVETRHFWFSGRRRFILSVLRETHDVLTGRLALDIGCGTGFVLAELERAGMLTCGIDLHLAGLRQARQRLQGVVVRASQIPFDSQFDVALLCDVIEHVVDDIAVLRAATRAIKEGGTVVVTVPAFPWLWSRIDEASGHKRRYTRQMLVNTMRQAGLDVVLARFFGIFLLPVQFLQRWRLKAETLASREHALQVLRESLRVPMAPLNALLGLAMSADMALSRLSWVIGSSLIAVGRRGSDGAPCERRGG
jgi:SAM-dependent methyltransferase